jgi:hypothetical protein
MLKNVYPTGLEHDPEEHGSSPKVVGLEKKAEI